MTGEKKQKSSILKDALMLFLITLIAGSLLGLVNEVTKEPIANSQQKAKEEAYQVVLADGKSFDENKDIQTKLETATFDGAEVTEVLEAKDADGQLIGYVESVTAKEGYGGDVKIAIGVSLDGTMTGFSVLSHSETAGLGANCTTDGFKNQFAGLKGPKVVCSKDADGTSASFDALSGATITSRAVAKAVTAGLSFLSDNGYTKG